MTSQGSLRLISKVHTPIMIIALISSLAFNNVMPLSLAFIISVLSVFRSTKADFVSSLANWFTLSRGLIIAFLGFGFSYYIIVCFAIVALALDLIDGWIARRQNSASEFGAFLDGTTDAYFVSMITLYLYAHVEVPKIALLVCFLPYIVTSILFVSPRVTKQSINSKLPSWIAGFHFFVLLARMIINTEFTNTFLILSSSLVLASFCYFDFARLRFSK